MRINEAGVHPEYVTHKAVAHKIFSSMNDFQLAVTFVLVFSLFGVVDARKILVLTQRKSVNAYYFHRSPALATVWASNNTLLARSLNKNGWKL